MSTTTFEPYLKVDSEAKMSYFYLVPEDQTNVKRTVAVDSGVLIDVNGDGLPLGVEIFGGSELPQLKLIALGVRPHDVQKLLFELSLHLDLYARSV